ncbi:MAG: lamin tail domain-containing protein, partial [Deltaproteobacteria bacterium]|nr:lamin tail domain-containing protein [Deltaproteobacteria bacterium]
MKLLHSCSVRKVVCGRVSSGSSVPCRKSVMKHFNTMRHAGRAMLFAGFILLAMQGSASSASYGDIIINEINWAGDEVSTAHEWIELFNTTGSGIALSGWRLYETNTAGSQDSAVSSVLFPSMELK